MALWEKTVGKISCDVGIKMPLNVLSRIGFLFKVVHKLGCFSVFIFTNFLSFQLLNGKSQGLEIWHTDSRSPCFKNPVCDFWFLLSFKCHSPLCTNNERPWPLRWVLGQGSFLPLSQGEAFTLASISYLAILVKIYTGKKKKKKSQNCHTTVLSSKAVFLKWQGKTKIPRIFLQRKTKRRHLARPVSNLKALEFKAFCACFHLKVVQLLHNCADAFHFRHAFRQ